MTVAIERAVPGTSRRDQLRAIAIRESRAAGIWLDIFRAWRRIVTPQTLRDARRSGGLDVNLFVHLMGFELDRRVDELVRSLTGPILRADLDDFTTPLGALTTETLARNQIGDLVVDITARQRANLREQLVALFAEGPTDDILQGIAASTGLTSRQTRSVQNLRRRLIRDGIPRGTAVRRAQEHAGRLLRRRARLIARTEAVRFTALIVEERAKTVPSMLKQWVSARDGNVEEICVSLDNGAKIRPKDLFQGLSGSIARPPAHPGCRCVLELSKARLKPGRRKPKRRRPPRPRRVPIVEPPLPAPRPAPVGEARTAKQVGIELENVAKRVSMIEARMAQRNEELLARWSKAKEAGNVKLQIRLTKMINRNMDGAVKILNRKRRTLRRVIARPVELQNKAKFPIGTKEPSQLARRRQGVADFRELVHDRWLRKRPPFNAPEGALGAPVRIAVNSTKTNRSYAPWDGKSVKMSSFAGPEIVVHELAHQIEFHSPAVLRSALAFFDRRTAGEAPKWFGFGFRKDELSFFDAWIDPYIGKTYTRRGTEVLSMGMEYMARDPLEFWRKDADHFGYIWDIMRGQLPAGTIP